MDAQVRDYFLGTRIVAVKRYHRAARPPEWAPSPGDIWIETLSSDDTVTWEWDGNVWVYVTDSLWERHPRHEKPQTSPAEVGF